MMAYNPRAYASLLGLAEHFRTSNPPDIKKCIHCLSAIFTLNPPTVVLARTHLQLGSILFEHTKNVDLALNHLERAWSISQDSEKYENIPFESASLLADIFKTKNQQFLSRAILMKAIELKHNVYWHCRLLFQLAQIYVSENNFEQAAVLLDEGMNSSMRYSAPYTHGLFLLSRCMLLLIENKFEEVSPFLNRAKYLVENWQGNQFQLEYLKVFYFTIRIFSYLKTGHVKDSKIMLRDLQHSIEVITQPSWPSDQLIFGENYATMFVWLDKDVLCILVYLISVIISVQAGYIGKAHNYINKALMQILQYKNQKNNEILSLFQLFLIEHFAVCKLIIGKHCEAIMHIKSVCVLSSKSEVLMAKCRPNLHLLLGLYSLSMGFDQAAELHFNTAMICSPDTDLWTFANLNLGIIYLKGKREEEFLALTDQINPENFPSRSLSLKGAAYYLFGLHSFLNAKYDEAKVFARKALRMSSEHDVNRTMSYSLVMLGRVFVLLGNSNSCFRTIEPGLSMAHRIPDQYLQKHAFSVLRDVYRMIGDREKQNNADNSFYEFTRAALKDQHNALEKSEHNLIYWSEGEISPLSQLQ